MKEETESPDDAVMETEDEEVEISEAEPSKRTIFTAKSDPPVWDLFERYKSGDLDLQPRFQRRPVWDSARKGRLVESILLEVPLPIVYLAEEEDGKEEVIDGQQRLLALFQFLDNNLKLSGLRVLIQLKGKCFKDLPKQEQATIKRYPIHTVTIKAESDKNLRFEIFERLNTGAVQLNSQELRNCAYRGPYNDLLIELSKDRDFMFLLGLKKEDKRMRDVELVLRFAAFHNATYLKYRPPMKRFLNDDMKANRNIKKDKAEELRHEFKKSVQVTRSMLGPNAFKRFHRGESDENPDGYWEPKKFNASLYDVLMAGFVPYDKNTLYAHLDALREAIIVLMTEDDEFVDSIELSTSSSKMVTRRFDKWRQAIEQVLAHAKRQPRCFTRAQKQELYDSEPTCAICGNRINDVDDSAVDHIEQYWLGGKTIPENARLTHRYCNWARPRKREEPT